MDNAVWIQPWNSQCHLQLSCCGLNDSQKGKSLLPGANGKSNCILNHALNLGDRRMSR